MANRTTRDKLKRVLAENCIRNNLASSEAIAEFFVIYKESVEGMKTTMLNLPDDQKEAYQQSIDAAEMIMMALAQVLEGYSNLSAFIEKVNENV